MRQALSMKKIIISISILLLTVTGVTWIYFKNLADNGNKANKVFEVIPIDGAIVFKFKNEAMFYDLFKNFDLFKIIPGTDAINHFKALKNTFIDFKELSLFFSESDIYFSLHATKPNKADFLLISPVNKIAVGNNFENDFFSILKRKYQLREITGNDKKYELTFNNQSKFYFYIHKSLIIGSFDSLLLNKSIQTIQSPKKSNVNAFEIDNQRNKNAIAKLYINYAKVPDLLNHFSKSANPIKIASLKSFHAMSVLNINYQDDAFMFSGITETDSTKFNYLNLFLHQQPGNLTLQNLLPFDAATYSFFYQSNYQLFNKDLTKLFTLRKESIKLKKQINNISKIHSINIEKEFTPLIGNQFGVAQMASGEKVGIISTGNLRRLSFVLSTISSSSSENIRRFNDSYLLYYFFGDPFKVFQRPYYTFIDDHLLVANNVGVLNRFLRNYEKQALLNRTDKNISFQQYLSNQGNIFYFVHNSNSKDIIRTFLNKETYQNFKDSNFGWRNIYGLSVQFSSDKNKFFTNLYMNETSEESNISSSNTSLLDSLLN